MIVYGVVHLKSLPGSPGNYLPLDEIIELAQEDVTNFNERNKDLMKFFARYKGFTVRAIPLPHKKDLSRKPRTGLCSFKECKDFLEQNIRGNEENYRVVLSEWEPERYGGVLISGIENGRFIIGEIGKGLENLCFGYEIPLAGFKIDRGGIGHINNKTSWEFRDSKAKAILWKAFNYN